MSGEDRSGSGVEGEMWMGGESVEGGGVDAMTGSVGGQTKRRRLVLRGPAQRVRATDGSRSEGIRLQSSWAADDAGLSFAGEQFGWAGQACRSAEAGALVDRRPRAKASE